MANTKSIGWNPYSEYYVVFNGPRSGIYNDFDEALEAAWHSDELVEKYKTHAAAKGALRRYIKKHKSS